MQISRPISAVLSANSTQFVEGVARANASLKTFRTNVRNVQQTLTSLGKSFAIKVTAPIASGITYSLKQFARFDDAMTEATSIMADMSRSVAREMSSVARDLSTESTFGAEEIARGYFYLASAGMDAAQSLSAIGPLVKFASAGAFDLATATSLAVDAQSALGLKVSDVAENERNLVRVTDTLIRANTLANASAQQFSEALTNKAGPALKLLGKDVEEGVAVLAVLADQGVKAQTAGERFSMFIRYLQLAYMRNTQIFKRFGIEIYDQTGKMKNLADVVYDLERALGTKSPKRISEMLHEMGITARSQDIFKMLLGTSEKIREFEDALRRAGGYTENVASEQLKAFGKQMKILWNTVKTTALEIGESLAPTVSALSEKLKTGLKWFRTLSDGTKKWIGILVFGAAAIGPVLITLGFLASGVAAVASVFGGVVTGVGSLMGALSVPLILGVASAIGGIVTVMKVTGTTFRDVGRAAKEVFSGIVIWGKEAFSRMLGFVTNFDENMGTIGKWLRENWKDMFVDLGNMVGVFFRNMAHNIVQVFTLVFQELDARIPVLWDSIVAKTSEGMVRLGKVLETFAVQSSVVGRAKSWFTGRELSEQEQIVRVRGIAEKYDAQLAALKNINEASAEDFKRRMDEKLLKIDWGTGWKSSLEGFARKTPLLGLKLDVPDLELKMPENVEGFRNNLQDIVNDIFSDHEFMDDYAERSAETAAALERGTSAAYEAAYRGRNKEQEIADNTKKTADESEKQTGLLRDMSDKLDFEMAEL